MPSKTFFALPGSYKLGAARTSYTAARDATEGMHVGGLGVVQHIKEGYYCIDRSFLFFDTSELAELPAGAIITGATLYLFITDHLAIVPPLPLPRPIVQSGLPDYPHSPLIDSDYDRAYYHGDGAGIPTTIAPGYYSEFPLNAEGISWIQKGGLTKFCLRLSRDINNNWVGDEWIIIASAEAPGQEPYLVVEYELPVSTHTLTITATAGGTTDPAPGSHAYDEGTEVTVYASPHTGYRFDHWELDGTPVGTSLSYTVTMDASHELAAIFTEEEEPPPPGKGKLKIRAFVKTAWFSGEERRFVEQPWFRRDSGGGILGLKEVEAEGVIEETGESFTTPTTLELDPGVYTVACTYDEETKLKSVEVLEGVTVQLDFEFTPKPLFPALWKILRNSFPRVAERIERRRNEGIIAKVV